MGKLSKKVSVSQACNFSPILPLEQILTWLLNLKLRGFNLQDEYMLPFGPSCFGFFSPHELQFEDLAGNI